MPGPPSNAESASKRRDLGTKSITLMGSIALTMNNISGPGMLEFPAIFQVFNSHEMMNLGIDFSIARRGDNLQKSITLAVDDKVLLQLFSLSSLSIDADIFEQ